MKDKIEIVSHPNVTLRCEEEEKKYFPCPVCNDLREIRITKREKPYLTCNECGVQLFIRGEKGIMHFDNLIKNYSIVNPYLLNAIRYYESIENTLVEIESKLPILSSDRSLEIQKHILIDEKKRLKKYFSDNK